MRDNVLVGNSGPCQHRTRSAGAVPAFVPHFATALQSTVESKDQDVMKTARFSCHV